jgi:hypothetical protein
LNVLAQSARGGRRSAQALSLGGRLLSAVWENKTKDLVNNTLDWHRCIDHTPIWNACLRFVLLRNDVPLGLGGAAIGRVDSNPLCDSPHHNVKVVEFKNKHVVKEIDELVGVPGTSTEQRYRFAVVGDQGLDLRNIPYPMLKPAAFRGLTCFRIAVVSQLPVTVNNMISPAL